jgi:iduronate 2-sulfatase
VRCPGRIDYLFLSPGNFACLPYIFSSRWLGAAAAAAAAAPPLYRMCRAAAAAAARARAAAAAAPPPLARCWRPRSWRRPAAMLMMWASAAAPLAALLCDVVAARSTSPVRPPVRRSVLYLIADDFRPEMHVAYNQEHVHTPAFDRLAAEALTFRFAYCQQAVCMPSRNSFMSGRVPDRTGIRANSKHGSFRDQCRGGENCSAWTTMPGHFLKSGYITLGGGKTFHPKSPPSWDQPYSWSSDAAARGRCVTWDSDGDCSYFPFSYWIQPNSSQPKQPCPGAAGPSGGEPGGAGSGECTPEDTFCSLPDPDDMFYDHYLANHTIGLIREYRLPLLHHDQNSGLTENCLCCAIPILTLMMWSRYSKGHFGERPFFFMAGFARPHAPWRVPERFVELYENSSHTINMPTHRTAPAGMPAIAYHRQGIYLADGSAHVPTPTQPIDAAVTIAWRRLYYAAVSWLDFHVGRLMDELTITGLEDETIVLIHGDVSANDTSRSSPVLLSYRLTRFLLLLLLPCSMAFNSVSMIPGTSRRTLYVPHTHHHILHHCSPPAAG